jgi:Ca2+/Na+ antiporter
MIAGLSWVLVESAVQVAHILDISEAIIAVTILAAGTSIPDLLSSVIVAKQGRGGMAVSNAVGSNIFDILVGLGLPFLIMILIKGGDLDMNVGNLEDSVLFLLASIVAMVGVFLIARWKVGKIVGFLFVGLYVAYIAYAVTHLN